MREPCPKSEFKDNRHDWWWPLIDAVNAPAQTNYGVQKCRRCGLTVLWRTTRDHNSWIVKGLKVIHAFYD